MSDASGYRWQAWKAALTCRDSQKLKMPKALGKETARAGSESAAAKKNGSPGGTRTPDQLVNSQLLYRLSYRGSNRKQPFFNIGEQ
jgi:hypothetical protein